MISTINKHRINIRNLFLCNQEITWNFIPPNEFHIVRQIWEADQIYKISYDFNRRLTTLF